MNGLPIVVVIAWLSCWQSVPSRTHERAEAPPRDEPVSWSRCYEELGCVNNTPDWYHPIYRPLSEPPLERHIIKTTFRSFVKAAREAKQPFVIQDFYPNYKYIKTLTSYSKRYKTHVLIHDFTSNGLAGWIKRATRAMLEKNMGNVISVDWTGGAEPPYSMAVQNSRIVALEVAHLIEILVNEVGSELDQFHLIGMGIGAHIAAYAANKFKAIGRITGLDPSGLYFSDMPCFAHLDSEDAKLVDIIYTDVNKNVGQGGGDPSGHLNFYPNGALTQPGCNATSLYPPLDGITRSALKPGETAAGCSHKRAAKYFTASINEARDCSFFGYACPDYASFLRGECYECQIGRTCAPMGYPAAGSLVLANMSIPPRAKLFLETNDESPFCLYAYEIIITLKNPGDEMSHVGELADKSSSSGHHQGVAVVDAGVFCITIYSDTEDLVFRTNLNMGASQKPFVINGNNVYLTFERGPRMLRPSRVVLQYDSENHDSVIFVNRVAVVPMPKLDAETSTNPLCGPRELTKFVPRSQEQFTPCSSSCKTAARVAAMSEQIAARQSEFPSSPPPPPLPLFDESDSGGVYEYGNGQKDDVSPIDADDYYDNR